MLTLLFWLSIGLVLYAYAGYPLILFMRGRWAPRPVLKGDITPAISLVIVAHNEAATIGAKLDNALSSAYPREQIEIIVASDGSTDGTCAIAAGYSDRGVQLLCCPRQGKIPTLNAAVAHATGEILVLSDANSLFTQGALAALVRSFADPSVGAVAGNQCYAAGSGNAASFGERLYWSFDRCLKRTQSKAGSIISATGAIHAIRRELFEPVPLGIGDDFVISTRAILRGYRLVFEPDAIAHEATAPTDRAEFQRKVRVIVRGLHGLWVVRALFNPFRYGFYSLQIFSHKLLRWTIGWLLIVMFVTSLWLSTSGGLYRAALLGQVGFYGIALSAMALRRTRLMRLALFRPLAVPFYFCLANIAALQAWIQLMMGKRVDVWNPTRDRLLATRAPTGRTCRS